MIPPPNPGALAGIVACVTANGPIDASTLAWVGSGPRWNGLSAAAADPDHPPVTKANAMPSTATARAIRDLIASTTLYSSFAGCQTVIDRARHVTGFASVESPVRRFGSPAPGIRGPCQPLTYPEARPWGDASGSDPGSGFHRSRHQSRSSWCS